MTMSIAIASTTKSKTQSFRHWMFTLLVIGFLVTATEPVHARSSSTTHVVQRGETLSSIAARYGVSYQQLAAHNGITNPNRVRVGQLLRIPSSSSQTVPEQSSPARRNAAVPQPTSTSEAAGSSPASSAQQAEIDYTVRRGDSLHSIGARYGVTVADLMQRNNLRSNVIFVGQRLIIPATR
jgi:LysM repeat protein